jgi:hypothetical protein
VIQIVVSDEADAYTLFETLNERGIELSVLDLLKNYLFKKTGNSLDIIKRHWYDTLSNLDDNIGTKFLRHYWVSKNGRVQAGRLYREIRDSARTKATAMKLASDLSSTSSLYQALIVPDDPMWEGHDQRIRYNLGTLKTLNAMQALLPRRGSSAQVDLGHGREGAGGNQPATKRREEGQAEEQLDTFCHRALRAKGC